MSEAFEFSDTTKNKPNKPPAKKEVVESSEEREDLDGSNDVVEDPVDKHKKDQGFAEMSRRNFLGLNRIRDLAEKARREARKAEVVESSEKQEEPERQQGNLISRREFIGNTALTVAGLSLAALNYYKVTSFLIDKKKKLTPEEYDQLMREGDEKYRAFGLDPEYSFLYDNDDLDDAIISNKENIQQAAEKYNVDSNFVAGLIVVEQSLQNSNKVSNLAEAYLKKTGSEKTKLPEFLEFLGDVKVPEKYTDIVKGLRFGDASVGLGQVWMKTVRKYNLQEAGDKNNLELVAMLNDEKFNINCVAEFIKIVESNLIEEKPEFRDEFVRSEGVYTDEMISAMAEYYNSGHFFESSVVWGGPGVNSVRYIKAKKLLTNEPMKNKIFDESASPE